MTGSDGRLHCGQKETGGVWEDYMDRIGLTVMGEAIKGPVDCAIGDEVVQELKDVKSKKLPAPSDVSLDLVTASRKSSVVISGISRWI